ncbi:MAG TPA: ABC transporter ATP-binding protein [Candidatus Micrarchaeia archaeon]|nr:ABC transporter ATP-binding protein [Candidatus Micrarchaeia archaeon]
MGAPSAIEVRGVRKRFRIYHQRNQTLKQTLVNRGRGSYEEFWAVRDVSCTIPPGSTLGIIGANGSGKSTLLKCIAGILVPDAGSVKVRGRLAALLEIGSGFHPEYSGRENIYLNGALLGLPRRYIQSVFAEIVAFSELERFIDNPVKTYSSGQYMRLGFSVAVHLDPDVLLIDEVLAVGDQAFQRRCLDRIDQLKAQGRTIVFVSHGLGAVRDLCDTALWMDHGVARALGPTERVVGEYIAKVNQMEAARLEQEMTSHPILPGGRAGVGITEISYVGRDGPTALFETGDPFELRIAYTAPVPLEGARFYVSFVREDGVVALTVPTDDRLLHDKVLPAQGMARLVIPRLPLLEGLFRVTVGIAEIATGEWYTLLDRIYPFRVNTTDRAERGVALLGQSWSLPPPLRRRLSA